MEEIKIIFFALASFFGIEGGRFAAEKTTIVVNPVDKKIEVIQEKLFTLVQSEKDSLEVLEQWNKMFFRNEKKTLWAVELDSFPVKKVSFNSETKWPSLTLYYSDPKDLKVMGIWNNDQKNQFSINHIPKYNLKTKDGKLVGNYWVFNSEKTFSFTIEPFIGMTDNYKRIKQPIPGFLLE